MEKAGSGEGREQTRQGAQKTAWRERPRMQQPLAPRSFNKPPSYSRYLRVTSADPALSAPPGSPPSSAWSPQGMSGLFFLLFHKDSPVSGTNIPGQETHSLVCVGVGTRSSAMGWVTWRGRETAGIEGDKQGTQGAKLKKVLTLCCRPSRP